MSNLYYRSEGAPFDLSAFLKALLVGFLVAIPTAIIYDYAIIYIPIAYINIFSVIGFAFVLGLVISLVFHRSKVRHVASAMLLGGIVALMAWYVSWVFWISYMYSEGWFPSLQLIVHFFQHPYDLWTSVNEINNVGTWSLRGGDSVSGLFLWIVWGIEALIVIVGTPLFSTQSLDKPFSEDDDDWYDERTLETKFVPLTTERADKKILQSQLGEVISVLEDGDFADVVSCDDANYDGDEHMIATLYSDKMKKSFYITLVEHRRVSDEKDLESVDIVQYLSISPKNAGLFENLM